MSANPFHIIRSTEEPPEHLRKEVIGSLRSAVLLMRFAQLFLADYANTLFEKLSAFERKQPNSDQNPTKPDP